MLDLGEMGRGDKQKAKILGASYDQRAQNILVQVALANGREHTLVLGKSSFTFNKKHFSQVPKDELDRQMKITAELFDRCKGKSIEVENNP